MTTVVPKGWTTSSVGDVFEILDSLRKPINADDRATRRGDVPYYGATGQAGWISEFLFDEELILLGEDGAPFLDSNKPKAYVIRGKSWVNNHAHILRAPSSTPSSFWKHQLDIVAYKPFVSGTTRLKLPQGRMKQIPVLVPPCREQRRLAEALDSYLSRLDNAVSSLERVQAKLKAYRASVLKAAVEGRLVPTEASLARAAKLAYEPAEALLARMRKERRRRWEEAELGKLKAPKKAPKDDRWKAKCREPLALDTSKLPELPEGWVYTRIEPLIEVHEGMKTGPFGSLLKKHEHGKSGVPVLGIENIEPMRFVRGSKIHVTSEKARQLAAYAIAADDLLISRSGTVGEVCVVPNDIGEARFSTNVMRVRFLIGAPLPAFFSVLLNGSPFVRHHIRDQCKGTTRDFLNQRILSSLVFPLPPLEEQARMLTAVDEKLSVAGVLSQVCNISRIRTTRLRQSILKWAFEGKLVDQDPTDEPATKLLARIRAERAAVSPV